MYLLRVSSDPYVVARLPIHPGPLPVAEFICSCSRVLSGELPSMSLLTVVVAGTRKFASHYRAAGTL